MEKRAGIIRDKEQERIYHSLLSGHFKTVTLEKYNDAMMNLMFQQACDKVLGKNFSKNRISKRKEKKIKDYVANKIRKKYGKWVNLTNVKLKKNGQMAFRTNLDRTFIVPDRGRLYGAYYHTISGNVFFTEHCLERFEERANMEFLDGIINAARRGLDAEPTAVDILSLLINYGPLDYGRNKDHLHISVLSGIIALEDLGDVFIAKTFLSENMIKDIQWYRPEIGNRSEVMSFVSVLQSPCKKIDKPLLYTTATEEARELYNESVD